jgi:hypothetical protein
MANNFTGRQVIIDSTGQVGPVCNFKVTEFKWQDINAVGNTLEFTDAAGRDFKFTAYGGAAGQGVFTLDIGKLDWIEGPITVTTISSGKAYMILGYK